MNIIKFNCEIVKCENQASRSVYNRSLLSMHSFCEKHYQELYLPNNPKDPEIFHLYFFNIG